MGLYQNRIVVKVGTSTLTNEMGKSDLRSFDRLACVLSDIQNMGYEVILVSSGAIAVGTGKLNMKSRPSSMKMKQAAAAVGQCSMMFLYDKFFGDYDFLGHRRLRKGSVSELLYEFYSVFVCLYVPVVDGDHGNISGRAVFGYKSDKRNKHYYGKKNNREKFDA